MIQFYKFLIIKVVKSYSEKNSKNLENENQQLPYSLYRGKQIKKTTRAELRKCLRKSM